MIRLVFFHHYPISHGLPSQNQNSIFPQINKKLTNLFYFAFLLLRLLTRLNTMISPGRDMTNFQRDGKRTSANAKMSSISTEKRMIQSYGSGTTIFSTYFPK
jgi:hypothetical protein